MLFFPVQPHPHRLFPSTLPPLKNRDVIHRKIFCKIQRIRHRARNKMTAKICEILDKELGISGDKVYITYSGFKNWGWNGSNF